MRILSISIFFFMAVHAPAQYDIGLSGGLARPYFRNIGLLTLERQWNAAMFYRERVAKHTDFSVEVQLTNRELHGNWQTGEGSSMLQVEASDIHLQHLYISCFLDVRMGASGDIVVRFGPQFGAKISETFTGEVHSPEVNAANSTMIEDLQMSHTEYFQHDHRLLVGLGFRIPFGHRMALMLDPYFSAGFTNTLKGAHTGRSNEAGLRIGLGRRFYNRSLSERIRGVDPPAKEIIAPVPAGTPDSLN